MSSRPPKVTVLALAYNHSKYLTETLNTIRDQTFQDFELFIADDASTDNSAELIAEWHLRHQRADRLFLHNENRGLCATLNELLGCAAGDYLQLIACDDHLLPRGLERRVDALDRSSDDTAAVYSDALRMDENGCQLPTTFLQRFLKQKPAPAGDLYSQLLLGNFLPGVTVLMKRVLVEEVGGFDASLAFEDWDLWQRLSRRYEFSYCSVPTARYRIHAGNLHRTMPHQAQQFYRILAKHRDEFRARLRILRMIVRNRGEFTPDTAAAQDFLSWADDYRETCWFRKWFFEGNSLAQAAATKVVESAEGLTRPFSVSSRAARIGRAA